jgi:hypothetical protein
MFLNYLFELTVTPLYGVHQALVVNSERVHNAVFPPYTFRSNARNKTEISLSYEYHKNL